MCSTDNKDERVEQYLSLLQQKSVDGLIIGTGIDNKAMLDPLIEKSIPIALIARDLPNPGLLSVIVDDAAGGELAAKHLLALGHRRMAVLAEQLKVSSSQGRIQGFRQALEQAGVSLPASLIKASGADLVADGKRKALQLLQGARRPTAIFCCNDLLAIGTLQAAKELGLRVPDDLSIVGFDNTILASVTDPPLTTVAQPIELMGNMTVNLLIGKLKKETIVNPRTVLQPELVVRGSTAAPPSPSSQRP
jgi:LacI family transcriptional regulator